MKPSSSKELPDFPASTLVGGAIWATGPLWSSVWLPCCEAAPVGSLEMASRPSPFATTTGASYKAGCQAAALAAWIAPGPCSSSPPCEQSSSGEHQGEAEVSHVWFEVPLSRGALCRKSTPQDQATRGGSGQKFREKNCRRASCGARGNTIWAPPAGGKLEVTVPDCEIPQKQCGGTCSCCGETDTGGGRACRTISKRRA